MSFHSDLNYILGCGIRNTGNAEEDRIWNYCPSETEQNQNEKEKEKNDDEIKGLFT